MFKEILSDQSTCFKTSNILLDLLRPESSNNAIPNMPGFEPISSTLKNLPNTNTRINNSKKKTNQ